MQGSDGQPHVTGFINNHRMDILVDTGAQRSIVSSKFITRHKLWDKTKKSEIILKGIGDKNITNLGTITLPVSFPNSPFSCEIDFFIVNSNESLIILGTDFCFNQKIDILYSQGYLRGPRLRVPIFLKKFQAQGTVFSSHGNISFWDIRRDILIKTTSMQTNSQKLFLNGKGEFSYSRNYSAPKSRPIETPQADWPKPLVFLAQTNVTIPPKAEFFCPVLLHDNLFRKLQNKEVYFVPKTRDKTSPIFLAHNLITVTTRRIPLLFANLSDDYFTIKKYSKFGLFYPLDGNIEILPFSQKLIDETVTINAVGVDQTLSQNKRSNIDLSRSDKELSADIDNMVGSEPWIKDVDLEGLSKPQEYKSVKLLTNYPGVFSKDRTDLGKTNLIQADLNVKSDVPIFVKQYPLDEKKRDILKKEIELMEKMDLIEPSKSAWNSPLILIRKKDSTFRVVTDFRRLNKAIPPQSFPLPNFDETIEILANNVWYSNLDLTNAYSQVPLTPESRKYTGFTANNKKWVFKTLPFGLKNNVHIFQEMMCLLLGDMQNTRALCYVDDLCIFSKTFDDHLDRLEELFKKLQAANLKLSPKKCSLFKHKINFLGHEIGREGILPGQKKIEAVRIIPKPTSVREIRQFLGLASYFRRFCPDFAQLAAPLHELTKPSIKFKWTELENHSFNELKSRLCNPPILAFPDPSKEFIVTTDASTYGLGAILSQKTEGHEKAIAYLSRKLSSAELNYGATDLEMLAVCYAIEQFRPYLVGRKFTLVTDHRPLLYLMQMKNPNARHFRWIMKLQDLEFSISHRQGILHGSVDMLSRNPQFKDQVDRFKNSNVNMLKHLLIKPESIEEWKRGVCQELGLNFNNDSKPFQMEYIETDPNALFQQIALILTNDFEDFQIIRNIVHTMVEKNKKFIQKVELYDGDITQHAKSIKTNGQGGILEINMIASLLKIPIILKYAVSDGEDMYSNITLEKLKDDEITPNMSEGPNLSTYDSNDMQIIDPTNKIRVNKSEQSDISNRYSMERERIVFGSLESNLKHFPPLGCVIVLKEDSSGNWVWQNFDLSMPQIEVTPASERSKNYKNASRKNREPGDQILACSVTNNQSRHRSKNHNGYLNRQERFQQAQKDLQTKFSDHSLVRIHAVRQQNQASMKDVYLPSAEEIKTCQEKDEFCQKWFEFLKHQTRPKVTDLYFNTHKDCFGLNEDGLLTYTPTKNPRRGERPSPLLVLPLNMFQLTMEAVHVYMSHIGRDKTMGLMSERFYRPGLKRLISRYVQSCALCLNKKASRRTQAEIQYIPPASDRLTDVSIDVIGPLPITARRNRFIITMIDHFSRWVELVAVNNTKAETVAEKILIHWIARFGVPERLHSDNAQNFQSNIIKSLCKHLKIKKTTTSAYNPASNGILESSHRFLGNALKLTVDECQKSWDLRLPHVLLAYRTTIHTALADSPSFCLYGKDLRLPTEMLPAKNQNPDQLDPHHKGVETLIRFMEAQDIYRKVMEKETARSRIRNNKKRFTKQLNVGDIVVMWKPLTKTKLAQKLHRPYTGDYRIIKKIGKVNYIIQELNGTKQHIVHVNRILKKHTDLLEQTEHWAEVAKDIFEASASQKNEVSLNTLWKEEDVLYPVTLEAFTTRQYT